ncbi:hypothetical protein, partial [Zobellella denitrificans]|uniref:hypothetical protein n=1 Tax=Zobellella denitrificans TaxID=347534 RepID=UPI001C3E0068
ITLTGPVSIYDETPSHRSRVNPGRAMGYVTFMNILMLKYLAMSGGYNGGAALRRRLPQYHGGAGMSLPEFQTIGCFRRIWLKQERVRLDTGWIDARIRLSRACRCGPGFWVLNEIAAGKAMIDCFYSLKSNR